MPAFNYVFIGFAAVGILCGTPARAQNGGVDALHYRVDTLWPKELPNDWIMGQVGGMAVDAQDHIWVLQRPRSIAPSDLSAAQNPPAALCCVAAPSVLEFDTAGDLIRSWGNPSFEPDWPKNEHAIYVDRSGNVWISGNGAIDRQIIKFSPDGKQLLEIGHPSDAPTNNQDTSILGRPAGIDVDDAAHEVYIADGYLNCRIMVYDSETGAFKRGWGAYGIPLAQISNNKQPPYVPGGPISKQFGNVHAVKLSADGFVYVADRANDRIQVFTNQGEFVKEFFLRPATTNVGSVASISLSVDKQHKYLIVADWGNSVVSILRRSDGVEVAQFGHEGHNAGQFNALHAIVGDSKGNIYTGEAGGGERIQKFVPSKN